MRIINQTELILKLARAIKRKVKIKRILKQLK